jgi:membrane protease YdiL (CAAX protease family)
MPRSDLIMEVRRVLVNQGERRLRAGWRLLVGLPVLGFALIVANGVRVGVADATVSGPLLAGAVVLLAWLLYYAIVTGCLVALSWLLDLRTLVGMGLAGDGWWRNLGFGLVLGVVMTTVVFVAELAVGFVAVEGVLVTRPDNQFGVVVPVVLAIPGIFLFFVGVGVFEEVLSRGYLLNNIAEGLDGLGPFGARSAIATGAVVTSLLFGLVHLANPSATLFSTFNITVVGLFFAATYVLTDDLGIPIGVHIAWNFSLSSLYGFPVSGLSTPATMLSVRQTGPSLVTGGQFGPEGGLVVYLALAVGIALTWWWVRREEGAVRFRTEITKPELRKPRKHD